MAKKFKYHLRAGSKKDKCPACGRFTFVPYVDDKNKPVGAKYGRCERINNCGYIEYPRGIENEVEEYVSPKQIIKPTDFISESLVFSTFIEYGANIFFLYLSSKFGKEIAKNLCLKYNIGTAKNNGTIFWQKDFDGNYRTGKVFYYNENGKRNKSRSSWYVHNKVKPDFVLKQVFFGEHLLSEFPTMPVALCESEKTAVIMSHLKPEYIWVASGGSEMLNADRFVRLYFRDLTVFPDEGQFKKWSEKTFFIPNRKMDTTVEDAYLRGECEKGADILDLINF
jgi:hypothetical protein